jgi:hypothetical protein
MAKSSAARVQEEELNNAQPGSDQPDSIMEYSIDLNDQERPPVLPVGDYLAEIKGVEKKFGKDSGRPYLNVKWQITADNQPADFVEALGTNAPVTVFQMVFGCEDNPQSRYNMKQFCKAIGAPMSNRIDAKEFLGRSGKLTIKHTKDLSNQDQAAVQSVKSA